MEEKVEKQNKRWFDDVEKLPHDWFTEHLELKSMDAATHTISHR